MKPIIALSSPIRIINKLKDNSVNLIYTLLPDLPTDHPKREGIHRSILEVLTQCKRILHPEGVVILYMRWTQSIIGQSLGTHPLVQRRFQARETIFDTSAQWAREHNSEIFLEMYSDCRESIILPPESFRLKVLQDKAILTFNDSLRRKKDKTPFDFQNTGERLIFYPRIGKFSSEDYYTTVGNAVRVFSRGGVVFDPFLTRPHIVEFISKMRGEKPALIASTRNKKLFEELKKSYPDFNFVR